MSIPGNAVAPDFGSFQLEATRFAALPNVTVAFRGAHWSDGKATEAIDPGSLVVPVNSGGVRGWAIASSGAVDPRACIALKVVQVPDVNPGSEYNPQLGPNEIVNRQIALGEYVHAYRAGAFHLTLIVPDNYVPSDLIGWDPAGDRPTGKPSGSGGAWLKVSDPTFALFEVVDFRPLAVDDTLGILTVHSLRTQD
jgi:hypothetical protein